ncbi:hypothetical protein AYI68_g7592 [Smittium mucronatum]|uniref:Uncharacterized protein n=1 Tax=Smittium mucronatum TaxID=133383 RepID=A0A1R0GNA7_9FUNG|nr:hypothetical protein AYI68_g7592 [Smittium mucronatum]
MDFFPRRDATSSVKTACAAGSIFLVCLRGCMVIFRGSTTSGLQGSSVFVVEPAKSFCSGGISGPVIQKDLSGSPQKPWWKVSDPWTGSETLSLRFSGSIDCL